MSNIDSPRKDRVMRISDNAVAWIAAIIVIGLAACMLMGAARAHDAHRPDLDQWYGSLHRPGVANNAFGVVSCCSKTDCGETEAEMRGEEWWARLISRRDDEVVMHDWVKVPTNVILDNQSNPTGNAVICNSMSWHTNNTGDETFDASTVTVFCFIRPTES